MATSESIAAGRWFDKLGDGDQDEKELSVFSLTLDNYLVFVWKVLQGVVPSDFSWPTTETDHFSHWGVSSKVSIINRPFRLQLRPTLSWERHQ